MVEASAYCLEFTEATAPAVFIRLLGLSDRKEALYHAIRCLQTQDTDTTLFFAYQHQFSTLSDSPFVYWVRPEQLRKFSALPRFEPTAGEVRQGLVTGDNPRFVRAIWEVPPESIASGVRLGNLGSQGHVELRTTILQLLNDDCRWVAHVMAGASQPWYSPITVVVNWRSDGAELKNFKDAKGKLRSRPNRIRTTTSAPDSVGHAARHVLFPTQSPSAASRLRAVIWRFLGRG